MSDSAYAYLALVLAAETILISVLSLCFKMETPLVQFLLGAQEIIATRHIASTFLPVGYAALLGWAMILGYPYGLHGINAAILALHIVFALLVIVFSRSILSWSMPTRAATSLAFLIGLNPRVIANAFRETDTNLSLVLLLAILASLMRLRRKGSMFSALFSGAVLAFGAMVRPNLLLMSSLWIGAIWGLPLKKAATILLQATVAGVLTYAAGTALFHGAPFYPHNGPYNLYAGFNPFTEEALLQHLNAEQSVVPALAISGIDVSLDWHRQPDLPGINDSRDKRFEDFYSRMAKLYILGHPRQAARLTAIKLATLFRVGDVREDPQSRARMFRQLLKTLSFVVAVPFWICLLVYSKVRSLRLGSAPVIWMAILYITPFALSNADPRFRIALEGAVLTDTIRMLYELHSGKQAAKRDSSPAFPL